MKKISLKNKISNYLITRSVIVDFFNSLQTIKDDTITIDFKDVTFMSRSCADEYSKQKAALHKKVNEINVSKDVKDMLQLVQNSDTSQVTDFCLLTKPKVIVM